MILIVLSAMRVAVHRQWAVQYSTAHHYHILIMAQQLALRPSPGRYIDPTSWEYRKADNRSGDEESEQVRYESSSFVAAADENAPLGQDSGIL